jgi:glycosyltransferase involved in cell wall biosynthesis
MATALEDPESLAPLIAKGRQQAQKFRWEDTARQTLDTYLRFGLKRL